MKITVSVLVLFKTFRFKSSSNIFPCSYGKSYKQTKLSSQQTWWGQSWRSKYKMVLNTSAMSSYAVFIQCTRWQAKLSLLCRYNNNHFTALCLGLPGWAGTRSNIHPRTILIIIQPLSDASIYYDPYLHPCSIYVLNLFAQPLSKSSLVCCLAMFSFKRAQQ